ncbi:MAG: class I SAM-dependent methyltransferase [Hyphomonadaceae bacterium]
MTRALEQYNEEFGTFLTSVNAGFLNPGSPSLFDHALRNMPEGGAILEIGNCCGLSLNAIGYLARQHGRSEPIFSCDPWPFPVGLIAGTDIDKHEYRSFVIESFRRNLSFFSRQSLPHAIEASADDFFEMWNAKRQVVDLFDRSVVLGGAIGFAHIDGWHAYEAVKSDFDHVDQHLASGGFILFDDSLDNGIFPDVTRVTHEALATGRYEIADKNPNYLIRKI